MYVSSTLKREKEREKAANRERERERSKGEREKAAKRERESSSKKKRERERQAALLKRNSIGPGNSQKTKQQNRHTGKKAMQEKWNGTVEHAQVGT